MLGSGAKHYVGRVAKMEGNAQSPLLPHSYYQPRLFSEGDRVVIKEMGVLHGTLMSLGKRMVAQVVRELPERSWSSARDKTGLSMPSFGLNSNFLQGGSQLYLRY